MPENENPQRDYRDTVFLPKTGFPMKAGLPAKEPRILAKWQEDLLYQKLRAARKGKEQFILHDGPPYANGDMHIGHALNHILKDTVCRTQSLLGKDAPYVPGWDCHGLPIEWKIEEKYRKKKRNKDEVPAKEFRAECREYAQTWVDTQREQLKRLGINGDWDNPYLTMQFESESSIVAELMKFAESGQLYRGAKPIMWSPVEKTALAEAEVEYEEITSTQIDVAFEIVDCPNVPELEGAYAVIWTTTPWTIPVNQALAYGADVEYVLVEASWDGKKIPSEAFESSQNVINKRFLIARSLLEQFGSRIGATGWTEHGQFKGKDLAGTFVQHPMAKSLPDSEFYTAKRPMLDGSDFVTTESGTGLVHMAPDHGEDDFDLCKKHGINPKFVVDNGGVYRDDWEWLGAEDLNEEGKPRRRAVINPNFNAPDGPICSDLSDAGGLLSATADYKHSYPHSWRSKKKIIYRCTPQWFVPMDKDIEGKTLRDKALTALDNTKFVPEKGRNRLGAMLKDRPDWVLSRQRAWGVPITLFVDRSTGEYLVDKDVNARIIEAVRQEGVDAWDEETAQTLLGDQYKLDDYERVIDILDVWFDSGCTHSYVLESGRWPDLLRPEGYEGSPADLYLEGSDQHRGWFQSSLLESCATRGIAPYKTVLTHGFTMAADGKKMSKSVGNTISPLKVMEQYGADIIRLWALSVDFTEDHRIGPEILKGVADQYRKLRNTYRYMLGGLADFSEAEKVDVADMPELEQYMLVLLGELDGVMRKAVDEYDFNTYTRALTDFCNEDLSAFFFDIRKDRLYCDGATSLERRAYRTVMDIMFHALVRYAAPILTFTSEEVWTTRFPDADSVHMCEWPEIPVASTDKSRWEALRALREKVTEAIEPLRREKTIRSGLEAKVTVPSAQVPAGFDDEALAELFITAGITRSDGAEISVSKSEDAKCGRCWKLLPEVTEDGALCGRCDGVVTQLDGAE